MTTSVLAGARPPAPPSKLPEARFTFTPNGLRPTFAQVDAGPSIRLTIVSDDGLPHGVVIQTPAGRVRLVTPPGEAANAILHRLKAGHRYRVVPDGATDPVTLEVG